VARSDFYDIKDLGSLTPGEGDQHPGSSYGVPRPRKINRTHKGGSRLLPVFLVALIVAVIGVTVWLVSRHHQSAPKTQSKVSTEIIPSSSSNSSTQNYISNGSDLNLSFNYLSSWSVTPLSDNNSNDQTITVTSPLETIADASGVNVTGKVIVTVRPGVATISELNANKPTVVAASTQIAYNTPMADQYQYPYITFIHFSTGLNVAGAFEEVIVTGSTQFSKSEVISANDLSGLDPIISAAFVKCVTQACTGSGAVPLSINSGAWVNAAIFQQTLAIFESFKLN